MNTTNILITGANGQLGHELEALIRDGRKSDEGIILSTIHLSKGLEYDMVYLLDALQDIFPSRSADIRVSTFPWMKAFPSRTTIWNSVKKLR